MRAFCEQLECHSFELHFYALVQPCEIGSDAADLRAGQKVLIHAAAGGVGSLAVQLARWKGAYIIGTASGTYMDLARQLGADEVIDYRTKHFEDVVREADVVLDTIGGDTQQRSWQVLKKGGVLVSTVQPPSEAVAAAHGVKGLFIKSDLTRRDELSQIAASNPGPGSGAHRHRSPAQGSPQSPGNEQKRPCPRKDRAARSRVVFRLPKQIS